MSADFAPLEEALEQLTANMSPKARKMLAVSVAKDLRKAQARRIKANVEPPGDEAMEPRKMRWSESKQKLVVRSKRLRDPLTKARRTVRNQKLFRRATGKGYLRETSSTGDAQVGFVGAMARIMAVHQYGLVDTVTRDPSSPSVQYPARVVLGFDPADRERILDQVIAALSA